MKKHKFIECIEDQIEDGIPVLIEFDEDYYSSEITINICKDDKGNKVAILSSYNLGKDYVVSGGDNGVYYRSDE